MGRPGRPGYPQGTLRGEKHHQGRHRASSSSLLPEQAIPTSPSATTDEVLAAADAENHAGLCQTVDPKRRGRGSSDFDGELHRRKMHTLHPRNPRGHYRKSGIVAQPAHPETRSSDFTTSQRDTTRTVGDEGHAATRLHSPPSSLPHNSQCHRSTQDIVGRCQP